MEVVIVALSALAALVVIDAGYWIAMGLVRWAPVITAGGVAASFAAHHGAESLDALGIGFLAAVVARHLLRPRYVYDDNDFR